MKYPYRGNPGGAKGPNCTLWEDMRIFQPLPNKDRAILSVPSISKELTNTTTIKMSDLKKSQVEKSKFFVMSASKKLSEFF